MNLHHVMIYITVERLIKPVNVADVMSRQSAIVTVEEINIFNEMEEIDHSTLDISNGDENEMHMKSIKSENSAAFCLSL